MVGGSQTLSGSIVRLEPLSLDHFDDLCEAGIDPALWKLTLWNVSDKDVMQRYIEAAIEQRANGSGLPFAIMVKDAARGAEGFRAVGSSRLFNHDRTHNRVEIGNTWIGTRWQKTMVNTETKLLLIDYAFEHLKCVRVEFKTDVLNDVSRSALKRLGAVEEGVLRKHGLTWTGRYRDSIFYSILDTEWPEVRQKLKMKLEKYAK
jgi:RimJ/RimL family protein N-acetyltransferase